MKARLQPVFFMSGMDADYQKQLANLRTLLGDVADLPEPIPLDAAGGLSGADAVVFPQMLGDAYRQLAALKAITLPKLVITSEFGTMSMWDWEIGSYLRAEGVSTIAPYSLDQTVKICRALVVKRELAQTRYLVYQDNPGEGFQAPIFKRFYWWEDECTRRMFDAFGVTIEKRSFRELGAQAKAIPDAAAQAVWDAWRGRLNLGAMGERPLLSAFKMYIALRDAVNADPSIGGVGINCLNESHFSDTTPCLAWNMLYTEKRLIWGCEADTVSMLTKFILNRTLDVPVMMTNLYPFLMGQAALKHERISDFPQVAGDPANYILAAHCGYLGVLPQEWATEWQMKPKVLAIVDGNSTVIDARLPEGPITMAKLSPGFDRITVAPGTLTGYAQYPGSDCLNGAVIRVNDGHRLMNTVLSHHYIFMTGNQLPVLRHIAPIFGLEIDVI